MKRNDLFAQYMDFKAVYSGSQIFHGIPCVMDYEYVIIMGQILLVTIKQVLKTTQSCEF